jgi:hypothetical protein
VDTTEWKIAKSNQTCVLCGARFGATQDYFSALFEQGSSFERRDYCATCFKEHRPANVYSFWKTAVPEEEEGKPRRPVLDAESVLEFFRRLGEERDPRRISFRFVLALMLARKKVLKLERNARAAEGAEVLVFVERRSGERHEVPSLQMDETALAAASEELGRLLGLAPPPATAGNSGTDKTSCLSPNFQAEARPAPESEARP